MCTPDCYSPSSTYIHTLKRGPADQARLPGADLRPPDTHPRVGQTVLPPAGGSTKSTGCTRARLGRTHQGHHHALRPQHSVLKARLRRVVTPWAGLKVQFDGGHWHAVAPQSQHGDPSGHAWRGLVFGLQHAPGYAPHAAGLLPGSPGHVGRGGGRGASPGGYGGGAGDGSGYVQNC